MGLAHSPSVVTNGLVFYYDMNNRIKSWRGRPVTNQYALPTADVNGFSVQNSTFTRVRSGTFGGYDIQPTDYVWRYNISANDCPYHGNDVTINAGQTAVFSFDYYVDPTTTNYPVTNYLANFEGVVGGAASDPTPSIKGVWKRAVFTATAGSTGTCRMLLYPGACGGRLGDSGFILYRNPQVEFDAPGNNSSPFVAGTRSNTQAIYDLTNNNTITTQSLTYGSDGNFNFVSASSNYAEIPAINLKNSSYTAEAWIKRSTTGSTHGILSDLQYGWWMFHITSGNKVRMYHQRNLPTFAANDVAGSTNIGTGWTHVAAVFNTSVGMSVYVNGVADGSNSSTVLFDLDPGRGPQFIGLAKDDAGNLLSNPFNGQIAQLKVYNRALSTTEISQNFNAQRGLYGV